MVVDIGNPQNCYECLIRNRGYSGDGMKCGKTGSIISWYDGNRRRMADCPLTKAYWIFDDFNGDGLDYQCSFCHSYSRNSWDYCPYCGAYMEAKENPVVEEYPTVDWCRKCIHRYGSAACVDCYDIYKYFSDGTPPVELNPSNYMPKESLT